MRAEKTVNSDCVKRIPVAYGIPNPSPPAAACAEVRGVEKSVSSKHIDVTSTAIEIQVSSRRDSCAAHYFQGRYSSLGTEFKTDFRGEKIQFTRSVILRSRLFRDRI